jgi:2-oxoglutarate dehydrogenase E1 component
MHIVDTEIRRWIRNRIEGENRQKTPSNDQNSWLLKVLTSAEGIEKHLHRKYIGQKRFSLEGGESLIPILDELIQRAGSNGTREIVLGMAHRGRLNVLVNILGKTPAVLFSEFEGTHESPDAGNSGDVKYHLGFSSNISTPGGPVHLALSFNPSHLEIINPVVEGSVKARQDRHGQEDFNTVIPILLHGDAAFAGQGVVMETMNMSETRAYTTGGTIHIVINNQIGFTTSNPFDARSTLYCTDVANMVQAPVFHVNGDDPEAVIFVTQIALDYRMTFNKDVVIDLICYRRHGHNEADEPATTQPIMYQTIRKHPTTRKIYADKLISESIVTEQQVQQMQSDYDLSLASGKEVSRPVLSEATYSYTTQWKKYFGHQWDDVCDTSVPLDQLRYCNEQMLKLPPGFEIHPRVEKVMDNRRKMAAGALALDWGFAENMAYATLLFEQHNIRISGQDIGRGTFAHRHAILHNQKSGDYYIPLQHLEQEQGKFYIFDSLLSEVGVLGFEYGYSSTNPETLVVWEAQFGDFANGAQVVIDQFISSGETKWNRLCGLVMLLPHGYEGQGPEHSSARLERYLQLCAEQNMQVCSPTTPAQIFHLLRRQIIRPQRKPLIVMSPKSLLRHKQATSTLEDLTSNQFQPVIPEHAAVDNAKISRVVLCSGKVYYDLLNVRDEEQLDHIAIVRIEQLYPFPIKLLEQQFDRYPNLKKIIWCQEEPKNQGAWYQIRHRLVSIFGDKFPLHYVGRKQSASPAVGNFATNIAQQKALVEAALHGTSESGI